MPYYDLLLTLEKSGEESTDKYGNSTIKFTASQVWGGLISVTQSEFYSAATQHFKPEKVIEIWERDYNGEEFLIHDNIRYEIYRSFYKAKTQKRELYLRIPENENKYK